MISSRGRRAFGSPAVAALIVVLCLLAGCGGGAKKAAAPAPASPAAGSEFLGVSAGAPLLAPGFALGPELRLMAASGVQSLRAPFYWRIAQPYRTQAEVPPALRARFIPIHGVPTSFAPSDGIVEAAARAKISVLPVVLGAPGWAARHPRLPNSPPAGTASYAAFARALVERYGPRGSFWTAHPQVPRVPIRTWQVWNEPNHSFYWSDQPFQVDYVRLLRAAHDAIHAADPGARVLTAGFAERSWETMASLYRAGARGAFDVAAIHPYTFEVANVVKIAHLVRAALVKAGDAKRPLMITELSWSSGVGHVKRTFGFDTTEADQAVRLRRAISALTRQRRALGIERMYWESWMTYDRDANNPFDFSGLREERPGGGPRDKAALGAYRQVALRIEGCLRATPDAPCG